LAAGCEEVSNVAVRRGWTPAEDEFVRRAYPKYPAPEIAKYLNRTTNAVHIRAHRLGVKKPHEARREIALRNLSQVPGKPKREMPRHIKEALGFHDYWRGEAITDGR
jgi:hypothetical protein